MSTCEIYLKCRGQEYATIPMRMSVLYDINNNIKTKSRIIDKSKTNCTHLFFYTNETITLIDLYVVLHPIDSKYMYMCVYSILCTCIKALYCFLVDEQFLFSKRLLSYSYEITQRHVGRGERREGGGRGRGSLIHVLFSSDYHDTIPYGQQHLKLLNVIDCIFGTVQGAFIYLINLEFDKTARYCM